MVRPTMRLLRYRGRRQNHLHTMTHIHTKVLYVLWNAPSILVGHSFKSLARRNLISLFLQKTLKTSRPPVQNVFTLQIDVTSNVCYSSRILFYIRVYSL